MKRYVIEFLHDSGVEQYLACSATGTGAAWLVASSANRAIRFERREDAEAIRLELPQRCAYSWGKSLVVEREFPDPAPPSLTEIIHDEASWISRLQAELQEARFGCEQLRKANEKLKADLDESSRLRAAERCLRSDVVTKEYHETALKTAADTAFRWNERYIQQRKENERLLKELAESKDKLKLVFEAMLRMRGI
jgi:hypothetical protein